MSVKFNCHIFIIHVIGLTKKNVRILHLGFTSPVLYEISFSDVQFVVNWLIIAFFSATGEWLLVYSPITVCSGFLTLI